MNYLQDIPLKNHSTMRLGGTAAYLCSVSSPDEVVQAVTFAQAQGLRLLPIGSGSNIIWRDEGFKGVVAVNAIPGLTVSFAGDAAQLVIGAGETWDDVVAHATQLGLHGIECLSLIPGKAGATPIQNVGAYGQDISQTLVTVDAYDMQRGEFVTIPAAECDFGYRTSRFKTYDKGRFFITSLTLKLQKRNPEPPFYNALQQYFDTHGITEFTPQIVRDAVIAIRRSKLPDWNEVANNGSFFANPIVSAETLQKLLNSYPDMPYWPAREGDAKIPAAWLIEQAGYKDFHDPATGMATWAAQPLVLVNEHAESTADLLAFKQKIVDAVQLKFGITLEQEPELLP